MDVAYIILEYVQVLAWPVAAILILFYYRRIIERLLPGTRIRLTLAGVTIETTLDALKESIEEITVEEGITQSQWSWLERMQKERQPVSYDRTRDYRMLMPIRNAGLIRVVPRGYLSQGSQVELTPLGRLFMQAHGARPSQAQRTAP